MARSGRAAHRRDRRLVRPRPQRDAAVHRHGGARPRERASATDPRDGRTAEGAGRGSRRVRRPLQLAVHHVPAAGRAHVPRACTQPRVVVQAHVEMPPSTGGAQMKMLRPKRLLLAGLLAAAAVAALGSRPAAASTLTVCSSGCSFAQIAPAVAAAKSGDTIAVAQGTYNGGFTIDKSVKLAGAGAGR